MDQNLPMVYQKHITGMLGKWFPLHDTTQCQSLEKEYFTCISNYGFELGKQKCNSEKINLNECRCQLRSKTRSIAMAAEREKQGKEPLPEGPAHIHSTPFH